jgi:hypothetical protein
MTTGPEHFREAENLAATAMNHGFGDEHCRDLLAAAQVHATLALAAATAMSGTKNGMAPVDFKAWDAVAGVPMDGDA